MELWGRFGVVQNIIKEEKKQKRTNNNKNKQIYYIYILDWTRRYTSAVAFIGSTVNVQRCSTAVAAILDSVEGQKHSARGVPQLGSRTGKAAGFGRICKACKGIWSLFEAICRARRGIWFPFRLICRACAAIWSPFGLICKACKGIWSHLE